MIPYEAYLVILVPGSAVALYESAKARAGWPSRIALAALALAAFIEASSIFTNMLNQSLSMISHDWHAFGWAFLVYIVSITVGVSEWIRQRGRYRWMATMFAIAGGMLAWHIVTELV